MRYVDAHRTRIATMMVGAAAMIVGAGSARAQLTPMPQGWHATGAHEVYVAGSDAARRPDGKGWVAASIKSRIANPHGAGAIQQSIRATDYVGKRVKLTGWLKTVGDPAGGIGSSHMWMRVDGGGTAIMSDFMWERPVQPGTDWRQYAIVLDVPHDATGITLGFCLDGAGQAWADDFALEVVDDHVPTTGRPGGMNGVIAATPESRHAQEVAYRNAPLQPVNLDFEARMVASLTRW